MVRHRIIVYVVVAGFDYNKLREWTWLLYGHNNLLLVGLFFTDAIQRVNRWYKIPFLNMNFQPSESAKLVVVITLAGFLSEQIEGKLLEDGISGRVICGMPFLLILKQPDLGTALVLFPITLVMFYFGEVRPIVVKFMTGTCSHAGDCGVPYCLTSCRMKRRGLTPHFLRTTSSIGWIRIPTTRKLLPRP